MKKNCPDCGSIDLIRNGRTRNAAQIFKCRVCKRQFVIDPAGRIPGVIEGVIIRMLKAGFPVQDIATLTNISKGAIYARRRELNG